jgi:hypothetical protein
MELECVLDAVVCPTYELLMHVDDEVLVRGQ